jgi:hypothetical protein
MAHQTLSLRDVRNEEQLNRLRRDYYDVGDWRIGTDGNDVSLFMFGGRHRSWTMVRAQHEYRWTQSARISEVRIPKIIFDRLLSLYEKQMPLGEWYGERFIAGRERKKRNVVKLRG